MINVTKSYLPPPEEYGKYLERIWASGWITNQGALEQELQARLTTYLDVPYFQIMTNGTIALQVAMRALDVAGEVITTPFSYVATATAILWEHCTPIFADIENQTFCLDPDRIEAAITERTTAILATHVYGYPCQVDRIGAIGRRHGLKVIYDGAHAFGTRLDGRSLLSYGDASAVSFHATKPFHTVEGGGVVVHTPQLAKKVGLYKSFGHIGEEYFTMGINGKMSEFHAAMGLCNLPRVPDFIARRRELSRHYDEGLRGAGLRFPVMPPNVDYNYSYYPVIAASEQQALRVKADLAGKGINVRRYFYPSLNTLPYLKGADCPVSEDVARRVLCLPLYHELDPADIARIIRIIRQTLSV